MVRHIAFIVLAVATLGMIACDDASETGRTIVSITSLNNGTPVESDVVVDNGTDPSYVAEDLIPVELSSRYYNDKFITGDTRSQVIVESYRITWTRTDGGSGALATRDEASHITVTIGDVTDAEIRLVTWDDKAGPILSPLMGSPNQVTMRADIEFTGREVGTTAEIKFQASISVHFADAVNI